jgi:hypothetical protein
MRTSPIIAAAHAVCAGGIGFVPMPPGCNQAAQKALRNLATLGDYRHTMQDRWNDSVWGYELDEKGQFNKGLSQWRSDERKDVFHFSPNVPGTLERMGATTKLRSDFFDPCILLHKKMLEVGLSLASQIDAILPGNNLERSCREALDKNVLRLLAYHPRTNGITETAYPHKDRAFLTFHVFETAPGLCVGSDASANVRVSVPHLHIAAFPGRKLEQMTNGKVPALWHGTKEVPELEPRGRRACVFFLHSNVELVRSNGELG